jgi:hypothetical protein
MKKIIIAAIIFIALQCVAVFIISRVDLKYVNEEVDMEIYGFEHEGHEYMMFEENGQTISVIHDPDCSFCSEK